MRFASKALAATSLILILAATSLAQTFTGAWTGKVLLDTSKLPKAANAQQQQMMDKTFAMVKKMRMNLTLNKNKTFKIVVPKMEGMPSAQTAEGTWSQKGSVITLLTTKENGAAPKGKNPPQTMTISKDNKTLSLVPPGGMPGKVLFTR